ncbi:unnamed protein product [Blepharisma stoltei]|uniref:Uncharacterized protein n=1 Tax=Blepharisma stoltei TaxID=1481888 RepID=A0AAU9IFU8_9CILI|nr:unnamed protein product [Blepharisma stoltei]
MVFHLVFLFTLVHSAKLNSSSKQSTIEPTAAEEETYRSYDCSTTSTLYIKEVCDLCSASTVYVISSANATIIDAYDQETQDRVQFVLTDAEDYMPDAKYYAVSINDTHACMSASKFIEDANYTLMFNYYLDMDPISVFVPEIFDIGGSSSLEYISTTYNESYDYFALNYNAPDSATVSETVIYNLQRMYSYFIFQEGKNLYTGTCDIGESDNVTTVEFSIETPYDRQYGESFNAVFIIADTYGAYDWTTNIEPDNKCWSIDPPSGISSLENMIVSGSYQEFVYSSQAKNMAVQKTYTSYEIPNWSLAPEINLENATGEFINDDHESFCEYEIAAEWNYLNYTIEMELNSDSDTNQVEISGTFLNANITMQEIETDFYQVFFSEDTEMFPEFFPNTPNLVQRLQNKVLSAPKIKIYLSDEISYNIYGESGDKEETEVIAGRGNSSILSVINSYAYGSEMLKENGVEIIKSSIYTSTETIDIQDYSFMSSLLDSGRENWDQGAIVEISAQFNQNCENNDFCSLLQKYAVPEGERILDVNGYVVNNTVYLDSSIQNIPLSDDVEFEDAGLAAEYTDYGITLMIKGAFDLQVDSKTALKFIGKIKQGEQGDAILEVQSKSVWENAMDVENLLVAGLTMNGTVDGDGIVYNTTTFGSAFIGEKCWNKRSIDESCLEGEIDMDLSLESYLNNTFSLSVYNITTADFFNYFGGYEFSDSDPMPLPMECLAFPVGIHISHSYESPVFVLTGDAEYCGILGELDGKTDSFTSGVFDIEIDLFDFEFANENAQMSDATGYLSTDRSVGKSEGFIYGVLEAFFLEDRTNIYINEGYFASLAGFLYDGIYRVDAHLIGTRNSSIESSEFESEFVMEKGDTKDIEAVSRDSLQDWVDRGQYVINFADKYMGNLTRDFSDLKEIQCETEKSCPTKKICPDGTYEECKSYPNTQICEGGSGCSDVELVCVESESVCMKTWKNCKNDDCECLSTVNVCKKWKTQCNQESSECRNKAIDKDYSDCERYETTCDEQDTYDLQCQTECDWNRYLYEEGEKKYKSYKHGYENSLKELRGFESITEVTENEIETEKLIDIKKIYTVRQLNDNVGPSNFYFTVNTDTINLETEYFGSNIFEVEWNFYQNTDNEDRVLGKFKEYIVEHSEGLLDEDLVIKDPVEIVLENIVYDDS